MTTTTPTQTSPWRTPAGRAAAVAMVVLTLALAAAVIAGRSASPAVGDVLVAVALAAFGVAVFLAPVSNQQANVSTGEVSDGR